ncbi:MAG TPA: phosphatase PAP2 family protein [Abditibacteriaceae bacterium]|jgi:membrane-associated phospholipid phosphatase
MHKTLLFCGLSVLCSGAAHADKGASRFASGAGTGAFLAAGVLLPLLRDGDVGKERSLRAADSLLTSTLVTEGLKRVVRADRPNDPNARDGFPSSHATAAFAVATMQAHYRPREAFLWYGGAALISASRVDLRQHRTRDVAAGAAIGYLTAKLELRSDRGLLLRPFIKHEGQTRTAGLEFSRIF